MAPPPMAPATDDQSVADLTEENNNIPHAAMQNNSNMLPYNSYGGPKTTTCKPPQQE